ncbi:MAG: septum formation initiator family protein [Bacteroidota bacterium]|jgi:cell division protein FtsB|nr:septum formation initiator family protein [Flavisolibacter sp.]MDQ3552162.1 septum formation initiator family protein [Bacteroidota bacterium]
MIAAIAFVVWMLFFDRNDFFQQQQRRTELKQLKEGKQYFQEQIEQEQQLADELKNNPASIEKFAREKYLMKKDNEDLFLIQPSENR